MCRSVCGFKYNVVLSKMKLLKKNLLWLGNTEKFPTEFGSLFNISSVKDNHSSEVQWTKRDDSVNAKLSSTKVHVCKQGWHNRGN